MLPKISKITSFKENCSTGILFDNLDKLSSKFLTQTEEKYLKEKLEKEDDCTVYKHPNILFFGKIKEKKESYLQTEAARASGAKLFNLLKTEKNSSVQLMNFSRPELMSAFLEGLLLASYSFSKYKKEKDEFLLKEVYIFDKKLLVLRSAIHLPVQQ